MNIRSQNLRDVYFPLQSGSHGPGHGHIQAQPNELPFEQLSRLVESLKLRYHGSGPQPHNGEYRIEEPSVNSSGEVTPFDQPSPETYNAMSSVVTTYSTTVRPIVESLFTTSAITALQSNDFPGQLTHRTLFSTQLRLLVYASSNNLAGLSGIEDSQRLRMMFDWLNDPFCAFLSDGLASSWHFLRLPSIKPMAETLFRCAIEVGDAEVVRQLVRHNSFDINADTQICRVDGTDYTPVERAACLRHLALTEMLVALPVDVKKSCSASELDFRYGGSEITPIPHGALEWLIWSDSDERRPDPVVLKLGELLLRAKGQVRGSFLRDLLHHHLDRVDVDILKSLFLARTSACYQDWAENDIFHMAFQSLETNLLLDLIEHMHSASADLDAGWGRARDDEPRYPAEEENPFEIPTWGSRFIELAAERGELDVVRKLLQYGANLTPDVLTAAVRSQDLCMVQFLLQAGASAIEFSLRYRSTPLAEAVRGRNAQLREILLMHDGDEQPLEEFRYCALLAAASEVGDEHIIRTLLHKHENDRQPDVLGYAMLKAIHADQTEAVMQLLEAGASTYSRDCQMVFGLKGAGYTPTPVTRHPVLSALKSKNAEILQALLEHDGEVVLRDEEFPESALELAVAWGNQDVIGLLIDRGVSSGNSLTLAIREGDSGSLRVLLQAGICPSGSLTKYNMDNAHSPLHTAIEHDAPEVIRQLLAAGADPGDSRAMVEAIRRRSPTLDLLLFAYLQRYPSGLRNVGIAALIEAITTEQEDVLQRLVSIEGPGRLVQISEIKMVDEPAYIAGKFTSAFAQAIISKSTLVPVLISMLAEAAISLDGIIDDGDKKFREGCFVRTNKSGSRRTALLLAIETNQAELVRALLDNGANINLSATAGVKRTPLQKAAETGSYSMVQLLLERNADVHAAPAVRGGATALQLAAKGGYLGIAELLLSAGASPYAPGAKVYGRTAMEGAAEQGRFDMVKYLSQQVRFPDSEYESAAKLARENGHEAVADMIHRIQAEVRRSEASPWTTWAHDHTLGIGEGVWSEITQGEPLALTSGSYDAVDDMMMSDEPEVEAAEALASTSWPRQCDKCGKSLCNASAMSRHNKTVHGDENTRTQYPCDRCERAFARKDILDRHKARKHKD